jgi:hypothetical protein
LETHSSIVGFPLTAGLPEKRTRLLWQKEWLVSTFLPDFACVDIDRINRQGLPLGVRHVGCEVSRAPVLLRHCRLIFSFASTRSETDWQAFSTISWWKQRRVIVVVIIRYGRAQTTHCRRYQPVFRFVGGHRWRIGIISREGSTGKDGGIAHHLVHGRPERDPFD